MIKYLKYMFVAAIAMIAATGCQKDWEDTFSTAPVAPELQNNGAILMTQNTMSESITWAWTAARFMTGEVSYKLYAQYGGGDPVQLGETKELSIAMAKTQFLSIVTAISGVPQNDSFDIAFYVSATDTNGSYESAKQSVKVYAYGDAVAPVVTPAMTEVVLDMSTPSAELALLSWEPARLGYNEAITYNVYLSYNGGNQVEVANGLTTTSVSKTVDQLNELVVAAGAPEAEAADVDFTVYAYSATYEAGVPSAAAKMNITTYVATFPDCYYMPGSYQGWNPATAATIAQSTLTKGLFEGFIDLTTEDGSDVQFKFSPVPEWNGDFGFSDVAVSTDSDGNVVAKAATTAGDNIVVPSGLYRVSLNKKFNTLEMVKIESMGIIGNATPGDWNEETPMTYDAAARTYSVVANFKAGEYKFRANNNWVYSIGPDATNPAVGTFVGSEGNFTFDKADGEYKITLDVSKHPYTARIVSTAFPTEEFIYIPGNHQGWSPATAPALKTDEFNGVYRGFSNLNGEFKFTKMRSWDAEYNSSHFMQSAVSEGIVLGEGGANINMTNAGFYYIVADVVNGSLTATSTAWGIIGSATANGWDADQDMAWNADKGCWSATGLALTDGEIKFRANDAWDINVGGDIANLTEGGANIVVAAGTYDIDLYLERTTSDKFYCVITKK